jgi:hypothetical protein
MDKYNMDMDQNTTDAAKGRNTATGSRCMPRQFTGVGNLHLKQQRDGDRVRDKKYLVSKLAGIQHISPLNSGGAGG